MGGQKFQYDESGSTFFYFVLSFLALILIPTTIYSWPRKKKQDPDKEKEKCKCTGCVKKRIILATSEPYKHLKSIGVKSLLVLGWILLIYLAYKVSEFDYEMSNFDPYEILGISPTSSQSEIKKAYRKLSIILHPDKETGDEKAFMKLTKAYQALTDEEARKNWEKYGNPDGPGAMSFGIALPSWIVEKENSVWVLGLYALVFMVALPVTVGMWWYRSIRYLGDKVLLDTAQMYFYFFHKTPQMALKRVIMILAASMEFDKRHNSQVIERFSDNEEVPALIRQLPNLNEKCKEMPLCKMYSIKTRAILHAHLSRISLNPETLEKDRQFIVNKCPYLIQEMVSCVHQLIMLAYARRIPRLPSLESIENCMKLSPMVVQALWEHKNPILQLPYLTDDILHFMMKKRHIKNLQQFAQLKPEDCRSMLKHLGDFEYDNAIKVLGKMPLIDFSIKCEVIDDENTNIVTAGAIVTVTVTLVRKNMKELFGDMTRPEKQGIKDDEDLTLGGAGGDNNADEQKKQPKPSQWSKPKQKHKGKGKSKGTIGGKHRIPNQANTTSKVATTNETKKSESTGNSSNSTQSKQTNTTTTGGTATNEGGDSSSEIVDDSDNDDHDDDLSSDSDEKKNLSVADDDDDEWERIQQKLNKREKLEGKSKVSHTVHCPYFPDDKQEYWWTYICDRKSRTLLTAPYYVTGLVDSEEIQLKFTAPRWPGVYTFTVCLRSDSYMGMDQQQELKLDVQKAPAVTDDHPQWDISESESEHNDNQEHESEFTTDTSDNDD